MSCGEHWPLGQGFLAAYHATTCHFPQLQSDRILQLRLASKLKQSSYAIDMIVIRRGTF